MKTPLLLVIDMINDSFTPETRWLRDALVGPINELLRRFHEDGRPVIWVRQEFEPDLDSILDQEKPDSLVLAGVNTHACIRTCAIDAYQRDWRVVLARECIGSFDQEHHWVSMKYMDGKIADALSNREILERMGSQG